MTELWQKFEPIAFRLAQLAIVVGLLFGVYTLVRPYLSTVMGNPLGAKVVVFDPVKLANAQRMVASAFIRPDAAPPDAAATLMAVQKSTRAAITKVAGEGTLVLVKQAVINAELPDITAAVLKELGLPTDAPTQNATAYTLDDAPTNLSLIPRSEGKPAPLPLPSAKGGVVP